MDGLETKIKKLESQKESDALFIEYLRNDLNLTKKQLSSANQVIDDLKSQLASVQALLSNQSSTVSIQLEQTKRITTLIDLSNEVVEPLDRSNIVCYSSSNSESSSITDNNSNNNSRRNGNSNKNNSNIKSGSNTVSCANNINNNINIDNIKGRSGGVMMPNSVMLDDAKRSLTGENLNNSSCGSIASRVNGGDDDLSDARVLKVLDRFMNSHTFQKGSKDVAQMIENNLDVTLVSYLKSRKNKEIQIKSLKVLNNLIVATRENQFKVIMDRNDKIIPLLVELINKGNNEIQQNALWIMNNIVLGGKDYKRKLSETQLYSLFERLRVNKSIDVIAIGTELISTMTSQSFYQWDNHNSIIHRIILFCDSVLTVIPAKSTKILMFVCSILFNLTEDEQNEILGKILGFKRIVKSLIFWLSQSTDLKFPAIGVLANLAAYESSNQFPLIKCGLMEGIVNLLQNKESDEIVTRVCRLVSNLTSGNESDIQAVIDHDILPTMVNFMNNSPINCRLYAAYAVVQALPGANQDQIAYLIKIYALEATCKILSTTFLHGEPHLLLEILKNFHYLFEKFDHVSYFEYISSVIDKYNGWQAIQNSSHYFKDRLKRNNVPDDNREIYTEICTFVDGFTKQSIIDFYATLQKDDMKHYKEEGGIFKDVLIDEPDLFNDEPQTDALTQNLSSSDITAHNGSSSQSKQVSPRKVFGATKRKNVSEIIDVVESNKKLRPLKVCSSQCTLVAELSKELLAALASDKNEVVERLTRLGFAKGATQMELMMSEKLDVNIISILESSNNVELLVNSLKLLNKWIVNTTTDQFQLMMRRNENLIPIIIKLIKDPSDDVQENAIWILDNIVLDGAVMKRKVLDAQVLPLIIRKLRKSKSMKVIPKCVKLLCSLSSYSFFQWAEDSSDITSIVECITEVLSSSTDSQVLIHCNNALFNLTSDEQEPILMKMSETADLTTALTDCFSLKRTDVTLAALHTIANMTALDPKENYEAFPLVRYGILGVLAKNWSIFDTNCVKQAYRTISNISRGNEPDVQAIIDSGLMSRMLNPNKNRYIYACYSIVYVLHGANLSQVQYLVEHGIVQTMCKMLESKETKFPHFILELLLGLKALFEKFNYMSDFEYVSELVDSVQGWSKIVKCANHFRNSLKNSKMTEDKFELLAKLCNTADSITKQNMMDYYRQMELERNGAEISEGKLDWHIFGKEEVFGDDLEVDFMLQDDLNGFSDEDII